MLCSSWTGGLPGSLRPQLHSAPTLVPGAWGREGKREGEVEMGGGQRGRGRGGRWRGEGGERGGWRTSGEEGERVPEHATLH